MEVDKDHIHLLIQAEPKISPLYIVKKLKGKSTMILWKDYSQILKRFFWKERTFWSDGYFISSIGNVSEHTLHKIDHNGRSKRVHVAVVHEFLNIDKTPEGYNIHHRNCNRMDNRIENLVLLTDSEHRWLHQEFGNAILNAVFNGDIDMNKLISFSKDSEKAEKLLKLCILDQKDIILPKVEI